MRATGRLVAWAEARSQIDAQHGTFIGERVSGYAHRLWWTPEDVAALSPHPCGFGDDKPPELWEHILFDEWCRSRYTNPQFGSARLVDIRKPDEPEWLSHLLTAGNRYVCVC
jgi:hypothetical protein